MRAMMPFPVRIALRVTATLGLSALLAGCMVMSRNPEFPAEWAPASTARIGGCPLIAGRYLDDGELYVASAASCIPQQRLAPGSEAGSWDCSLALVANLGLAGEVEAVELRQPDEQTLDVTLQNAGGATLGSRRLRLGHDFRCDADSLYISGTRSMLGGPGMTAAGILFLSGGVTHHTRAFAAASGGALVMTVRERMAMYHVVFGAVGTSTSYVRWPSAPAAAASAP